MSAVTPEIAADFLIEAQEILDRRDGKVTAAAEEGATA